MIDPTIWRVHDAPLLAPLRPGPLDGVGVAVKDLFAVAGHPVGAGNPRWLKQARAEPADALAVHALRAAGAGITGIAHTDELAFSLSGTNLHYGTPPNPAAPELVPGGSSSGPAAAVATGQADVGLGTDTAGSIRVPAAACGLFGLRPTHGAVPTTGVIPLAPSFDTVGWLTRDAALLHRVGDVLLPPAPLRPPARLIAVDDISVTAQRLAGAVGAGLTTVPAAALIDVDALLAAFRTVQAAEAWQEHGRWITTNRGALAPDVEARFRFGAEVSAGERTRAWRVLRGLRLQLLDALDDTAWLLLPMGPAHRRDAGAAANDEWRMATLRRTVIASAFGLPSCVLPQPGSPPTGLALVGPPGADRSLLDAAVRHAASAVSA